MPSSPSVATGPRWSASDYAPAVTGSGARKLAESGVAPLVATARGYESVLPDQVRDAALRFGLGSLRAAPAVQLRTAVGTRDALVMPWYRPEDVLQAGQVGARPLISTRQYRPHEHGRPVDPQTGKTRKYLNAMGIPTGMDVHPATPADWIINPAVTLMTEGMLKADSALSAMLLAYGVPAADLSGGPDDGASLEVLRAAMTAVPQDKRVLVVSLVGVSNWHQNPEWNTIRRNGREFWVAFDGDVATKAQVWWEAHQLWEFIQSKGGRPRLLDLRITADEHGAPAAKIGVDDYLVSHGDWNQLLTRLVDELPPRPAADDTSEKVPKSWRINDTEHVSEEYDEVPDPFGSGVRKYAWQKRLNLAARVLCLEERRWSTPSEDETGMLDAASDEVAGRCEVEVTWKEDPADSAVSRAVVRGPATILADPPGDWHRRGGAEIPALVAQHPDWPPSKREWVSAIKRHRRNEVAHLAKWEHMGWVPAETGSPVFIVGEQVIGAEGESTRARPGVTEKVLAKASGFGVSMPSDDQDARDTLTRVVRTYLDDVWTDRRVAALVLATALRPIVPVRCATSVMFVGTRGRGKSYAAESIMAFWQSRPGQWNGSLPGTASDTAYYMENAVARTPIWVADDLAPTADARKSLSEQSSLGQILRFVHNKTGKGRMQSDGFTRNLLPPRAVFVATAENALNVASEMDRVIPIKVYAGFLNKSQKQPGALRKMRADTDLPMKVAGTCARYVARQGERMGWPATHEWWEAYRQEGIKEALEVIGKRDDAFRHAELGSDVALGIYLLIEVCKSCGVDAETMDLIYPMMNDIYSLAGEGYEAQTVTTPGQQTIRAMRALLTSGYAHLAGPGKAGPPIPTTDERYGALAAFYNQRVGWPPAADARDHPRPNGKQIGFVLTDRKGVLCALLDPAAAFTEARRTHPDLIPPGSGQTEAWNSAWSEGLTSTAWARKQDGSGRPRPVVRTKGLEGVPIPLNVLLGLTAEDENDLGEEQRLAAVTPPVAEAGDRDFD